LCYKLSPVKSTGAQWYEQFLQVRRLDQALIVLGLAFYLCGLHDAVYMLNFVVTFFALAEPAGIGP